MALLTGRGLRINRYYSMADFPFFKMAAVRHLGFSKVENFNRRSDSEDKCASSCQISWRSVEPLRRYGQYSIFKMAAVHQLQFLKVGNFKFGSSSEVQYESSCQISRRSVEPFRRSGRFFKMATVRHLWFFLRVLVPSTKSIWWSLWLCKIWL